MSFEDLQKKWGGQFSEGSDPSSQLAEAKLLKQIRQSSRRFYWLVALQALRDLIFLAVVVLVGLTLTRPDTFSKTTRGHLLPAVWIALGLVGALTVAVAMVRAQPGAPAKGSVSFGRLQRESRRFNAMVLWWDLEKASGGAFLIFFAVAQALHVHSYPALSWVAVALYISSLLAFFTRRWRNRRNRPATDDSVLGMLTVAIYNTRCHVEILENMWWYVGPLVLGALLIGPVRAFLTSGVNSKHAFVSLAVLLALSRAAWKANQWIARSRWRPRLDQLETLKAEFAGDPFGQ